MINGKMNNNTSTINATVTLVGSSSSDTSEDTGNRYDAVIKLDNYILGYVENATLISGSYSDCVTKALNQEPLNIMVYGAFDDPNYPFTTTFKAFKIVYDNYIEDSGYIGISVFDYFPGVNALDIGYICWDQNSINFICYDYSLTPTLQ